MKVRAVVYVEHESPQVLRLGDARDEVTDAVDPAGSNWSFADTISDAATLRAVRVWIDVPDEALLLALERAELTVPSIVTANEQAAEAEINELPE